MENMNDTWENRIEQASKIMGVTPQKLEEILNSPGFEITKEPHGLEMLSDDQVTPFGDLRKLFCEDNSIAVPKLRMAITYLRGTVKDSTKKYASMADPDLVELQAKFGIKFRMEDLGVEELVPLYKPNKSNRITETLKKKFGSIPVIAFKPETTEVAVEETINYMVDLEQGLPKEDAIEVDGELVKLVPVGIIPDQEVDEDPMFTGICLKRDRSVANRVSWEAIPLETRQLFRILVDRGDISANNRVEINQVINLDFAELKKMFPEAYLEYKNLKSKNALPRLKMSLSASSSSTPYKKNDPFNIKTNRVY